MNKYTAIMNELYVYKFDVEASSEKEAIEKAKIAFMYASQGEIIEDYFVDSHTSLIAVEHKDEN